MLAWVDAQPEAELIKYLTQLASDAILEGDDDAIAELVELYRHRCLTDCDCDPEIIPCARQKCIDLGWATTCRHVEFVFCEHVQANLGKELMPPSCQDIVLRAVLPDRYSDPPLQARLTVMRSQSDAMFRAELMDEMLVTSQPAMAVVYANRMARGDALRLPGDSIGEQLTSGVEDRINRHGRRLINGSDSKVTALAVHGQVKPPFLHADPLAFLRDDPRTKWLARQQLQPRVIKEK